MNRERMEIRCAAYEVRADPKGENGFVFSGYAARYDAMSEDLGGFVENIAVGAFAPCIGRDDVRCLINHDPNRILGRTRSGTLRLEDRPEGLWFEVDAPNAAWVRDLAESVRRGDIDQCSFAFVCKHAAWENREPDGMPIRTLISLELYDVSIVTYPAYPDTSANVRSAQSILAERMTDIDTIKRKRHFDNMRKRLDIKEKEIHG